MGNALKTGTGKSYWWPTCDSSRKEYLTTAGEIKGIKSKSRPESNSGARSRIATRIQRSTIKRLYDLSTFLFWSFPRYARDISLAAISLGMSLFVLRGVDRQGSLCHHSSIVSAICGFLTMDPGTADFLTKRLSCQKLDMDRRIAYTREQKP